MKPSKKLSKNPINTKPKEITMENQEPEQTQEPVEFVVQQQYSVGDTFFSETKEYTVVEVLGDNKIHIKCKTEPFNSLIVDILPE